MTFRLLEYNDYYKHYCDLLKQLTYTGYITEDNFINKINEINKTHNNFIYVKELNNFIIVTGTLLIVDKFIHNCGKIGIIEDIIVDKNYRSNGYGKEIINYLIEKAKEEKCYKIILNCNENYKKFYEKLGFINNNFGMSIYFD